ncbi:MAG: MerR family transcriptional regulator, heat shock protein HspR [Gaiellales bacterium]|nr:MerR family transcriptional regulator, heat shock protein HspR [Gaiellales bacterium]
MPRQSDHPRYSISVAAELAGMHPQTLRMYDTKGLVSPRRTPGGTRRYSDSDIEKLLKINQLTTEMGLTLSGAMKVLALEETVDELTRRINALQSELDMRATRLQAEVAAVHRRYRRDLVLYTPAKPPTRWTSRS